MGAAQCKFCNDSGADLTAQVVEKAVVARQISPEFRRQVTPTWTVEKADALQESVNRIFGDSGSNNLLGLEFSFSIADPFVDGCPIIGCSTGFTKLTGYELEDIIGRNCRFMVDPVPKDQIDQKMRARVKSYCEAMATGSEYHVPESDREEWMPTHTPGDELICVQKNARKDGIIFNNMFWLKMFELGLKFGDEMPYIVGLQTELMSGKEALGKLVQNREILQENMGKVKDVLASAFYMQCCMSRE